MFEYNYRILSPYDALYINVYHVFVLGYKKRENFKEGLQYTSRQKNFVVETKIAIRLFSQKYKASRSKPSTDFRF